MSLEELKAEAHTVIDALFTGLEEILARAADAVIEHRTSDDPPAPAPAPAEAPAAPMTSEEANITSFTVAPAASLQQDYPPQPAATGAADTAATADAAAPTDTTAAPVTAEAPSTEGL